MRRAAKKDGPHDAIVQALEAVGIVVMHTFQFGEGFPDIVCYQPSTDRWLPVEIKTPSIYKRKNATYRGKPTRQGPDLSDAQKRTHAAMPFPVAETPAQALSLFGIGAK